MKTASQIYPKQETRLPCKFTVVRPPGTQSAPGGRHLVLEEVAVDPSWNADRQRVMYNICLRDVIKKVGFAENDVAPW